MPLARIAKILTSEIFDDFNFYVISGNLVDIFKFVLCCVIIRKIEISPA